MGTSRPCRVALVLRRPINVLLYPNHEKKDRTNVTEENTTKRCSQCAETKPPYQFYKNKGKHDGLQGCCKQCSKDAVRKWQTANPEKKRDNTLRWRAENRELVRQQSRAQYIAHRDAILAKYAANPEKSLARSIADRSQDPVKFMLRGARSRAKQFGLPFAITKSDVADIPDICPALGVPIVVGRDKASALSASIDRRIGSRGYVSGNVAVISWRANMLKREWTAPELHALADKSEDALTSVELRAVAEWLEAGCPQALAGPATQS